MAGRIKQNTVFRSPDAFVCSNTACTVTPNSLNARETFEKQWSVLVSERDNVHFTKGGKFPFKKTRVSIRNGKIDLEDFFVPIVFLFNKLEFNCTCLMPFPSLVPDPKCQSQSPDICHSVSPSSGCAWIWCSFICSYVSIIMWASHYIECEHLEMYRFLYTMAPQCKFTTLSSVHLKNQWFFS